MCRMLWRLGCCLIVVAAIGAIGLPAAYGQCATVNPSAGGGVSPSFNGSAIVGATNQPAVLVVTNTSALGCTETASTITLNPSCDVPTDGSQPCPAPGPDLGVYSVSATGTGATTNPNGSASACSGITFTLTQNATTGNITFTPGSSFTLATLGSACTINFTYNLLKLPTVDCRTDISGAQTCQTGFANFVATSTTGQTAQANGSGNGSQNIPLSCAASIDKQVVCDGSANWQDTDFNNTGGATGCVGTAGVTGVNVRYRIQNQAASTTTNVLPITSCTVTETNTVFGATPNPAATFPIAIGATSSFFGRGSSGGSTNALECSAARAGETGGTDTAAANCACNSGIAEPGGTPTESIACKSRADPRTGNQQGERRSTADRA
jgi:hypothetical protein